MMRSHKLALHIADASWGEIRRQLTCKTDWNGKELVIIDRFFPSSQTCGYCGYCGYRNKEAKDRTARVFELFSLDTPGFSGFLPLSYPVCGP